MMFKYVIASSFHNHVRTGKHYFSSLLLHTGFPLQPFVLLHVLLQTLQAELELSFLSSLVLHVSLQVTEEKKQHSPVVICVVYSNIFLTPLNDHYSDLFSQFFSLSFFSLSLSSFWVASHRSNEQLCSVLCVCPPVWRQYNLLHYHCWPLVSLLSTAHFTQGVKCPFSSLVLPFLLFFLSFYPFPLCSHFFFKYLFFFCFFPPLLQFF